ncbi:MAG: hypothetical protein ACREVE_09190 [Gammaproteobacteria bacterium]
MYLLNRASRLRLTSLAPRLRRVLGAGCRFACIRDAESILLFGPGEAKDELKQRLEGNNLAGRVVGVETVDKMTDRQIAAKVRQHFAE